MQWGLLQVTRLRAELETWDVKSEQKWRVWCVTNLQIRQRALRSNKLRPILQTVTGPGDSLQLLTQQKRLDEIHIQCQCYHPGVSEHVGAGRWQHTYLNRQAGRHMATWYPGQLLSLENFAQMPSKTFGFLWFSKLVKVFVCNLNKQTSMITAS